MTTAADLLALRSHLETMLRDAWDVLSPEKKADIDAQCSSVRHYLRGIPVSKPMRSDTFTALEKVGEVLELGEQWKEALEQYKGALRSASRSPAGSMPTYFGVIHPGQPGHPYPTLEAVRVTRRAGSRLSGWIHRLSPPEEAQRNFEWDLVGFEKPGQAIFASFHHRTPGPGEFSLGTISLRRVTGESPHAVSHFVGHYDRLQSEDPHALVSRAYGWYPRPPIFSFWRTALLDFDWTLRDGWVVGDWLGFLEGAGVVNGRGRKAAGKVGSLFRSYVRGVIPHDDLVARCQEIYSRAVEGVEAETLVEMAKEFVDRAPPPWDFSYALIDLMRRRGVHPIIVTGAPAVVVREFAKRFVDDDLDVPSVHGLELTHSDAEAPVVLPALASEPGTSVGKGRLLTWLLRGERREARPVALAVGDSESDSPLWQAAERSGGISVVVSEHDAKRPRGIDSALCVDPTNKSSWQECLGKLEESIPPDEHVSWTSHAALP